MYSPLEQFEVLPLKGIFYFLDFAGLSVTNFTVSAIFAVLLVTLLFVLGVFDAQFLATPSQYFLEFIYNFVYGLFLANLSEEEHVYFPYVFSIFILIFTYNLLGLFPYGYTITSQIIVAALLSFSTFVGLLWIGISRHGFNFIGIFFPPEAPALLSFLLVPIEIVSFFSRPFSLAIRLFANMTAGHVLLKILAGFAVVLLSSTLGLEFNCNKLFYWIANGFNRFNYLIYPEINSYYISWSFFDIGHISYNYNLFAFSIAYYYAFLFHIEDLLQNSISDSAFWIRMKWRVLLYVNYLAPVFAGISKKAVHFNTDMVAILVPIIPKRDAILFSHTHLLYYILNPFRFYNTQSMCDWALLSVLNNYLVTFKIVGLVQLLDFISWCLSFILAVTVPVALISFFIILELFVSVLQAYVFTILVVIYLRDVIDLH
jgi:F-type H+-transporting ATPase subunit a